jgi:hypothetical protein
LVARLKDQYPAALGLIVAIVEGVMGRREPHAMTYPS